MAQRILKFGLLQPRSAPPVDDMAILLIVRSAVATVPGAVLESAYTFASRDVTATLASVPSGDTTYPNTLVLRVAGDSAPGDYDLSYLFAGSRPPAMNNVNGFPIPAFGASTPLRATAIKYVVTAPTYEALSSVQSAITAALGSAGYPMGPSPNGLRLLSSTVTRWGFPDDPVVTGGETRITASSGGGGGGLFLLLLLGAGAYFYSQRRPS